MAARKSALPKPPTRRKSGDAPSISREQAAEMMKVKPGEECVVCSPTATSTGKKKAIKAWPWPDGSYRMPLCGEHWPKSGRHGQHHDPLSYYEAAPQARKTTERREGREDW